MAADNYEFTVFGSLYKRSDADPNIVSGIGKEVQYKLRCYTKDILSVQEALNRNGRVYRDRCIIRHNECNDLLVKGGYDKISSIIFEAGVKKIGYGHTK